MSLRLFNVVDSTGSIGVGGPAAKLTLSTPGQRAKRTFTVAAGGQSVAVVASSSTFSTCATSVYIESSTGTLLGTTMSLCGASGSLSALSLSAGTYRVVLDGVSSGELGSVSLALVASPHAPVRSQPRRPSLAAMHRGHRTSVRATVRTPDGHALAGVTMRIGTRVGVSDRRGDVVIVDVPAGHQALRIDGTTAQPHGAFGYFEEGIDVVARAQNRVPAIVWMTPLDRAHITHVPEHIVRPLVVTTPAIPGLELHIPAGTVIRDRAGRPVRTISISPIATQTPPFPLPPGVVLPTYFTIQPGGAHIEGHGVQLVYPNWGRRAPGTRTVFWNYEADDEGWYSYGGGTVSANGTRVVPDPGVELHEFSGAMADPTPPPSDGPGSCTGGGCRGGDPVDTASGLFLFGRTDLRLPDVQPIELARVYRQQNPNSYTFGLGTTTSYDLTLYSDSLQAGQGFLDMRLILPDGTSIPYQRRNAGSDWQTADFREVSYPGMYLGSRIHWDEAIYGWYLTLLDGTRLDFGVGVPLRGVIDPNGNETVVFRSASNRLDHVTSPNGRWIDLAYGVDGFVSSATDNARRAVSYTYDVWGRLVRATDVRGYSESYAYDARDNMTTVTDKRGTVRLTNTYNADDTVATQTGAGGSVDTFVYTKDPITGRITSTRHTDPVGSITVTNFDAQSEPVSITEASGTALERTTTYSYDVTSHQLIRVVDPLGRRTDLAYTASGSPQSVTRLAGSANVSTTTLAVDARGRLTSVTDTLGHTTTSNYVDSAELGTTVRTTTDATGRVTVVNARDGRIESTVDAAGSTTRYTHDHGDLSSVTNPDGRVVRYFFDAAGLLTVRTEPSGTQFTQAFDPLGHVVRTVDGRGGVSASAYDAAGDLTRFTDANGHVTTYAYDARDRRISTTDPLGRTETFSYDAADDVVARTSRAGAIDTVTYDALGRVARVAFGVVSGIAHSSVTSTYDAGDRPTTITDTTGRSVAYTYDGLDDVLTETQPNGTVVSSYDALGRRTSVSLGPSRTTTYGYDAAGRLTAVTRGSAAIGLSYDTVGRLAAIAFPGGLSEKRSYSKGSLLTKVVTGTVTTAYAYDGDGLLGGVTSGALGVAGPDAQASATYDAADEPVTIGATSFTHDANGNVLSAGTTTYTWNDRGRLASSTTGGTTTALSYDALGRASSRTVGGATTSYLSDGADPAATTTATGTVDDIVGGGRVLAIQDPVSGTISLPADRTGSPSAAYSAAGSKLDAYTYSPSGQRAVATNAVVRNDIGFAGSRVAVADIGSFGARSYSATFGRWLSRDPAGIAGGVNQYEYAAGDPVDLLDRTGFWPSWMEPLAKAGGYVTDLMSVGEALGNAAGGLGPDGTYSAERFGADLGGALGDLAVNIALDVATASEAPAVVAASAAVGLGKWALKFGVEKYVGAHASYVGRVIGGPLGALGANAAASFSSAWNSVLDGLSSEGSTFLRSFMP